MFRSIGSQILAGKRAISADTAVRLGYWLGTGLEFWLNLQRQYELRLIEQTDGAAIRSRVKPLARTAA